MRIANNQARDKRAASHGGLCGWLCGASVYGPQIPRPALRSGSHANPPRNRMATALAVIGGVAGRGRSAVGGLGGGVLFEAGDALGADGVDGLAEFLDALGEPGEVFGGDAVVLAVAGLDVGLFLAGAGGPDISQAGVDPLGLGAQEGEVVDVGGVEGHYQQHAVVEALGRLVEQEGSLLVPAPLGRELRGLQELHAAGHPLVKILPGHRQRLLQGLGPGLG